MIPPIPHRWPNDGCKVHGICYDVVKMLCSKIIDNGTTTSIPII